MTTQAFLTFVTKAEMILNLRLTCSQMIRMSL